LKFKGQRVTAFCYVVLISLIIIKVVQREREEKLATYLREFLDQYVHGDKDGFINHAEAEARRLSNTGRFL
jgi:hypothetical protein